MSLNYPSHNQILLPQPDSSIKPQAFNCLGLFCICTSVTLTSWALQHSSLSCTGLLLRCFCSCFSCIKRHKSASLKNSKTACWPYADRIMPICWQNADHLGWQHWLINNHFRPSGNILKIYFQCVLVSKISLVQSLECIQTDRQQCTRTAHRAELWYSNRYAWLVPHKALTQRCESTQFAWSLQQ